MALAFASVVPALAREVPPPGARPEQSAVELLSALMSRSWSAADIKAVDTCGYRVSAFMARDGALVVAGVKSVPRALHRPSPPAEDQACSWAKLERAVLAQSGFVDRSAPDGGIALSTGGETLDAAGVAAALRLAALQADADAAAAKLEAARRALGGRGQ